MDNQYSGLRDVDPKIDKLIRATPFFTGLPDPIALRPGLWEPNMHPFPGCRS